jgi:hypothetical protein
MTGAIDPARQAAYQQRVTRAKAAAQRRMDSLARELLPKGKRAGTNWQSLPPHRASDNATAFSVHLSGEKAGGWIDFVTGETGDIFSLVKLVHGHGRFGDSLAWIEERCGLTRLDPAEKARLDRRLEQQAAAAQSREIKAVAQKKQAACRAFGEAGEIHAGSAVDLYWRSRGIDRAAFVPEKWLRFMPDYPYWPEPDHPRYPAMFGGFCDAAGIMQALHVTYLKADGAGKAAVAKPKMMFGPMKGCVIPVARGSWPGRGPQALQAPVTITEGIEDALSIAMLDPGARVWAAGSLSNYLALFDHPSISCFVLVRDNDWGKPQPAALFERARLRLRTFGKPVEVIASPVGKDFNDYLQQERGT